MFDAGVWEGDKREGGAVTERQTGPYPLQDGPPTSPETMVGSGGKGGVLRLQVIRSGGGNLGTFVDRVGGSCGAQREAPARIGYGTSSNFADISVALGD